MIDAYLWNTPNGHKLGIALEELGVPYTAHLVNLGKGEQKEPAFVAINPNGRIPAIVDQDGPGGAFSVFESGAILLYLAEKTGKLLPTDPRRKSEAVQWLMFQMSAVGPMLGQAGFFLRSSEKVPMAIDRYVGESRRLIGILDTRLGQEPYLAGEYSVADIATFPWIAGLSYLGLGLDEWPNVKRWFDAIAARPAVQRGLAVCRPPVA